MLFYVVGFLGCTGKNEEIVDCPADADETCTGKLPGTQLIPCFNKGCHCKKNFVRHEGSCITRKDCRKFKTFN